MRLTFSPRTFNAGETTIATVVIEDVDVAYIWTEFNWLRFSLDNQNFSDEIQINTNGTYSLYVKVNEGIESGSYSDAVFYELHSGQDQRMARFALTIVGAQKIIERLNFSLSPRSAVVPYSAEVINTPVNLGTAFQDSVLDHAYSFEVERYIKSGDRKSISGAFSANKLLYKLIIYEVEYDFDILWGWERPKFTDHITKISQAIGIPIQLIGSNFYPKTDINFAVRHSLSLDYYEQLSGSFQEIMNRLIGWSDTVPSMTYNVFADNGTIYIVERGKEQNTRTPANWATTPTISHSIRRTQWAESQTQSLVPKQISSSDALNENTPYTGTITWGQNQMVYQDGYLVSETDGNRTVTYTYEDVENGKRLAKKETVDVNANRYIEVTYTYQNSSENFFLSQEEEVIHDGQDATGTAFDGSKTTYVPLGSGWYGVTTYNYYGEETGSSISQGAPGNLASQYTIDSQNKAIKPSGSPSSQIVVPLTGVARARQNYPVADRDTLQKIANALDSLEGKEEITLQGEIVGGDHIYNFNDKIVFEGETYYLVSNNVSQTPASIRQNITAVRWILS